MNYRQTFIAVKLEGACINDAFSRKFEQEILKMDNVQKIVTEQGLIYRVNFG
jgi:hypothetical protein